MSTSASSDSAYVSSHSSQPDTDTVPQQTRRKKKSQGSEAVKMKKSKTSEAGGADGSHSATDELPSAPRHSATDELPDTDAQQSVKREKKKKRKKKKKE